MPRISRYSRCDDDDYWYDKWCEYREQQEEEEEAMRWYAEVDENCDCTWAEGEEGSRYTECSWGPQPLIRCNWHKARAAARAAGEAAALAAALAAATAEEERAAAAAAALVARRAALQERLGVVFPEGYTLPAKPNPTIVPAHRWYAQIMYVRERLTVLEGKGLPDELRIRFIGEMFQYLALPENFGLVRENTKFRTTIQAKLAEFRADPRAAPLADVMDTLDAACAGAATV